VDKKAIDSYLKKYEKEDYKYILISTLALFAICIGLPLVVTLFIKDEYPHIHGMNQLQIMLLVIAGCYSLGILGTLLTRRSHKFLSMLLFESSQALLLILFLLGIQLLFMVVIPDIGIKLGMIALFILGANKVYRDIRNKVRRRQQAENMLSKVEKYGGIIFLILMFVRGFFDFNAKIEATLAAVLSPLLLVIAIVFIVEYYFELIWTLIRFLQKPEYYRQLAEIPVEDWYGVHSKEYQAAQNPKITPKE
jgi:uncharacterized protein with GYD domain